MNPQDALTDLRPLHLPEPVSWWPPAPGWWLLILLLIALAALTRWWWRRGTLKRAALRELRTLERQPLVPDAQLAALNSLLKRYALVCHPRSQVAKLSGTSWLEFLDRRLPGHNFTQGAGRLLAEAPYQPCTPTDAQTLIPLIRRWIRQQRSCP